MEMQREQQAFAAASSLTSIALILLPIPTATSPIPTSENNSSIGIECIQGGGKFNAHKVRRYELCAENLCVTKMKPPPEKTIIFLPEITLHEQRVQWKLQLPAYFILGHCQLLVLYSKYIHPRMHPKGSYHGNSDHSVHPYGFAIRTLLRANGQWKTLPTDLRSIIYVRSLHRKTSLDRFLKTQKARSAQTKRPFLRAPSPSIAVASVISLSMACQHVNVFTHKATTCLMSPNG
uniref:Secreted protein n=1 Tax=Haemonchus placei TaxID=6290 RepID=A0A0N4WPR1_HAEPC